MVVIARRRLLARSVAQSRAGSPRKQRDAASSLLRATAPRRAPFGAGRRRASVTMESHRSLLAPTPAPKCAPSRPPPTVGIGPYAAEHRTSHDLSLLGAA